MSESLKEQGDRDGFKQGWDDGLSRQPANPNPSLLFGLFDTDYLHSFRAAYKDGFETARDELARREYLLRCRDTHDDLEHSRDDV